MVSVVVGFRYISISKFVVFLIISRSRKLTVGLFGSGAQFEVVVYVIGAVCDGI